MVTPSDAVLALLNLFASSPTSAAILLLILALVYAWARPSATHPGSRPWSLAAGALLAGRAAWLAASLLGGTPVLIHILERFLTALGVLLLGWAALSTGGRWKIDRAATLLITSIAVLLAASIVVPPAVELPFNLSWVDFAWSSASTLLGLLVVTALMAARPRSWLPAVAGIAVLIAGLAAHIVIGPTGLSVPVFVRAGEVFGYALLAVAALRSSTVVLAAPRLAVPATNPAAHVGEVLTTMAQAAAVERPEDFARLLTESMARALRAEYCLLLTPPDPTGAFAIAAGFDLIREERIPGASLTRESCPALHDALLQNTSLSLEDDSTAPDLRTLQRVLELRTSGPALLTPMAFEGRVQAGLLLLTPYSRRKWPEATLATLAIAAGPMGARLAALRRPLPEAPAAPPVDTAGEAAQLRIAELEGEILRITQSAASAHAPEERIESERLEALRLQQDEALRTIDILESEISRLKGALATSDRPSPTAAEVQRLQRELSLALEEISELRSERTRPPESVPAQAGGSGRLEELRQPLTAISGYADLLLAQPTGLLGTAQRKFILRIREAVRRMEVVLGAAGAPGATPSEAGGPREPVDLMACIEEAMRALVDALREKNLTFRLDAPDNVPPVAADKAMLQKALASLLHNAALASRPDREILITLRSGREAEAVALSISDAGEGIPSDRLKDIFDRGSWASMKSFPGLGRPGPVLAEARSLVESQGGRVWVDSERGVGTTFTVLLPVPRPITAPP